MQVDLLVVKDIKFTKLERLNTALYLAPLLIFNRSSMHIRPTRPIFHIPVMPAKEPPAIVPGLACVVTSRMIISDCHAILIM